MEKIILIGFPWHLYQKSVDRKCQGLFLDSHSCSVELYVSSYARVLETVPNWDFGRDRSEPIDQFEENHYLYHIEFSVYKH